MKITLNVSFNALQQEEKKGRRTLNLIGRKHRSESSEHSKDYEHGYSDGYCKAERMLSDTIVFQDSYISALERRLKNQACEDSNSGKNGGDDSRPL
mgnify:CR=1 FL=1